MGMNFELDWEIANYRNLRPEHQARLRADALRRAQALRHEAVREVFAGLARGVRQRCRMLLFAGR
jgi:hypothetical protein